MRLASPDAGARRGTSLASDYCSGTCPGGLGGGGGGGRGDGPLPIVDADVAAVDDGLGAIIAAGHQRQAREFGTARAAEYAQHCRKVRRLEASLDDAVVERDTLRSQTQLVASQFPVVAASVGWASDNRRVAFVLVRACGTAPGLVLFLLLSLSLLSF